LEDPLLGYVIPMDSFTKPCEENSVSSSLFDPHPIDTPYNLGCPSLCLDGPHRPEPNESWIALVQRGGCQFVEKTREAQRLGAQAIVIGGDNPDIYGNPDTLVNMYSPGISVFFCFFEMYE
jgi:E3 ubiquitin-protein ligase RNF13/E3 ubiquitin-protein ligase RNF167